MSNKSRSQRIIGYLKDMSDSELQCVRTDIEIECANRDLPNKIDTELKVMNNHQVTVLFMTLYQEVRERQIIPDGQVVIND